MTDDSHRHGHTPAVPGSTLGAPLTPPLWVVSKGGELRTAALYPHPMGVELRIVDRSGMFVRTDLASDEAGARMLADAHENAYRAKGWTDLEG